MEEAHGVLRIATRGCGRLRIGFRSAERGDVMKRGLKCVVGCVLLGVLAMAVHSWDGTAPLIIDHTCTNLSSIPDEWIAAVQGNRRLHYVHTSHGEQLMCGLERLEASDSKYSVAIGGGYLPTESGALCVYDKEGDPDDYWYGDEWVNGPEVTRETLNDNPTLNTSMFCWCIQMEIKDAAYVEEYFDSLSMLESEYPNVTFIYMTGNAQRMGSDGYNRYLRNEQIRQYCIANNKVLFDFADLDSWWFDPSAGEWDQATYEYGGHTIPVEHPNIFGNDCGHASWENCEQKARGLWWMLARIEGFQDTVTPDSLRFKRGDANGDAEILMNDAVGTLRFLYAGGASPTCMDAADANDDGSVLMNDAVYTLRYLYVGGASPPPPFPQCDLDPTPDGLGCAWHPCGEVTSSEPQGPEEKVSKE